MSEKNSQQPNFNQRAQETHLLDQLEMETWGGEDVQKTVEAIDDALETKTSFEYAKETVELFQSKDSGKGSGISLRGSEHDSGHGFDFMEKEPQEAAKLITTLRLHCAMSREAPELNPTFKELWGKYEQFAEDEEMFPDDPDLDMTHKILWIDIPNSEFRIRITEGYLSKKEKGRKKLVIRIEPIATEVFRDGKPSEIPAEIHLSTDGYSISFPETQLMQPVNSPKNPINWTNEYLQMFFQENILNSTEPVLSDNMEEQQ